jgi:hypothetical protein
LPQLDWVTSVAADYELVDGGRLSTERELVTVCAWWDGPLTREVVDRQLAEDAAFVGDRQWIWVYDAPPSGSPTSWTGQRHYGDDDLVAWISQHSPDIVLTGHVHPSPFMADGAWVDRVGATLVFNAGRQPGPVPIHITLDTETGIAQWSSYEGVDERALAGV